MATKTLTITENAYNLLAGAKYKDESFSEEIIRLFSNKRRRPLSDFFGIISNEEGEAILEHLKQKKEKEMSFHKERLKELCL